jgi:hypothetical protein
MIAKDFEVFSIQSSCYYIQQCSRTEKWELSPQLPDSSTIPKNQSNEINTLLLCLRIVELWNCVEIGEENSSVPWELLWFC